MILGIERLLSEPSLYHKLKGKRCAIVGHPASVTGKIVHSLDALMACNDITITAAFGPQHGMRGDKQDNMIESADFQDPIHGIPVFSLYGETRKPTDTMMNSFDVLLFDVQDLGCRIYTYITTLLYLLEACAASNKAIWILDRPNPAGRAIEGTILEKGWESFVGAGEIIMRHGLTCGEIACWFRKNFNLNVELEIVTMEGYLPDQGPGFGWPSGKLSWINPSPNAASLNMARCFPGTVMLEGTNLSEGRGTTIPLEVVGAPDINIHHILEKMSSIAPEWLRGAFLRPCYFQPTFHKHSDQLCHGLQIHTDFDQFNPQKFLPVRLLSLFLKSLKILYPDYDLWRKHDYEYESGKLPIDLINGGPFVREWIDDPNAIASDLDNRFHKDEEAWYEQIRDLTLY